jgi:hypothetical protein
LFGAIRFERMARSARGGGTQKRGGAGRAPARNDADEAMEDAQEEIVDKAAALDAGTSAGESSGASAQRALPPELLQRRLDKAKSDAETAMREKEAIKKMNDLRAVLELAKSNIGDDVQVAQNPVSTPARKVCSVPLDLALNFDVGVIYLIQFCLRGKKQWQLSRWPQF